MAFSPTGIWQSKKLTHPISIISTPVSDLKGPGTGNISGKTGDVPSGIASWPGIPGWKSKLQSEVKMNEIEELKKKGWFPILRTGRFLDSKGREHHFDEAYLNDIKKNYNRENAEFKEAPMITGHLEDSAPARGWIDELKTVGKFLFAKAKEIPADFIEKLKKKEFKFISPSIRPNRSLRHVGFVPIPAIPGLGEFPVEAYANFEEAITDDDILLCFDFSEIDIFTVEDKFKSIGNILQKVKELIASITGYSDADSAINTGTIDFITHFPIIKEQNNNFNENKSGEDTPGKEDKLSKDKIPGKEKDQESSADFAEKFVAEKGRADKEKQRADEAEARLKEMEAENRVKEAADFCEGLPPGTIIPKFMPGMKTLLARLDTDDESFDFTEGTGEKETLGAFVRRYLKSLKPQIPLDPLPIGGKTPVDDIEFSEKVDSEDLELDRKARAIQQSKNYSYEDALREAQGGK